MRDGRGRAPARGAEGCHQGGYRGRDVGGVPSVDVVPSSSSSPQPSASVACAPHPGHGDTRSKERFSPSHAGEDDVVASNPSSPAADAGSSPSSAGPRGHSYASSRSDVVTTKPGRRSGRLGRACGASREEVREKNVEEEATAPRGAEHGRYRDHGGVRVFAFVCGGHFRALPSLGGHFRGLVVPRKKRSGRSEPSSGETRETECSCVGQIANIQIRVFIRLTLSIYMTTHVCRNPNVSNRVFKS